MKKLAILLILPFLLTACIPWFNQNQEPQTEEERLNTGPVKQPPQEEFILLKDVTGGSSEGDGYRTKQGSTFIHKVAADLPPLTGSDFYEGWLVIPGTTTFISTGEMVLDRGRWVLDFESETDYTDYSLVVITVEPDDGDPAPADHILEGEF